MKFVYGMVIMTVLLASLAAANQGFNAECQNFYGSDDYYAIEKWAYDDEEYVIDETNPGYKYFDIDVTGDLHEADWTSSPAVYSVLVKAGSDRGNEHSGGTIEWSGGTSGTVTSEKEISHITFCGYWSGNGGGNGGGNGVPEFPSFALGAAVLTATLGIIVLRKN